MVTPLTQAEQQAQPQQSSGPTGWQTPEFAVIETAMEVTAYYMTAR
jgi:coenzyme PQQ precursor peptide PqqA